MYENILGLNVQGGLFREKTHLEFFKKREHRVSIILGRNGSGKSTISRAINEIKKGTTENFDVSVFCDDNKQDVGLTEDEKKNIYVFNEDYIRDNINIEKCALGNIAIIGEQNIVKDEIKEIDQEIEKLQDKERKAKDICKQYDNDDGEWSVKKHYKNILDILRKNNGWAERGKHIDGLSTRKRVNDDIIYKILEHKNEENVIWLSSVYNEKMGYYNSITRDDVEKLQRINFPNKLDAEYIMQLLAIKLEQADFSEREKYLFELVSGTLVRHAEIMMKVLDEEQNAVCPFCLRSIDKSLKGKLLAKIGNILSEQAKIHVEQLKASKVYVEKIDLDKYNVLKMDLSSLSSWLNEYSMQVEYINELIEKKLECIYEPIVGFEDNISVVYEKLVQEIEKVNSKIDEYNKDILKIEEKRNELKELSFKIAYHEIKESYIYYKKLEERQKEEHKKLQDCQKRLVDKEKERVRKEAELKNIYVAVEIINKSLQKIFFDKNRIRVALNKERYYSIQSNGEYVLPNRVSVGERNIIALCYFFTELLAGRVENEAYKETYFLVIDDPVSSFDYENKIGIYTFLRSIVEKFIDANMDTKIIFLTHDVQAFYALKKTMSDMPCAKNKYCMKELKNHCIMDVRIQERNEYTELLKMAFDFACEKGNYRDNELFIGNVLRRVLESFSTFSYKLGIADISTDKNVLNKIQDEEFREYYKDLMYKLLLHGDSHMEENMRAIPSYGFEENFDIRTKVKIAKDIIVFLYLLDSVHVEKHLNDDKCVEKINIWKKEIKDSFCVI